MLAGIHLLALGRVPPPDESQIRRLAQILDLAPLEARRHLQPPGPRLGATCGDRARAQDLHRQLVQAGFSALLLAGEDVPDDGQRFPVRSFRLEPAALEVTARDGRSLTMPYGALRLVLRGVARESRTQVETSVQRRLSLTKAVVTGGLLASSEKKVETKSTTEQREGFVHLYADGLPCLLLREGELLYQGLGPLLQPTRTANWATLLRELRRLAPAATVEERLTTTAGQSAILGTLSPEHFLDVAAALLVQAAGPPPP